MFANDAQTKVHIQCVVVLPCTQLDLSLPTSQEGGGGGSSIKVIWWVFLAARIKTKQKDEWRHINAYNRAERNRLIVLIILWKNELDLFLHFYSWAYLFEMSALLSVSSGREKDFQGLWFNFQ